MLTKGNFQGRSRIRTRLEPPGAARDALLRLARNPKDACALIGIYDAYAAQLKESAGHWFASDSEACARAINNILVAIGREAPTYDPQFTDPMRWVTRVADAEAKKLRKALDLAADKNPRRGTSL